MEKKSIPWLVTWMTTLGQTAISLYIPAMPSIAEDLGITPAEVKSTLTAFFLGFGICQIFYGPLSDRFGRRPVLLFGIALFCIACFANLFVHSIETFWCARFFQGLGSGAVITIGRSILRDCFSGRELASATSHLSMGFAIAMGVSPVIGAYVLNLWGWRADFALLLIIGVVLFILLALKLPETAPKSADEEKVIQQYAKILRDWTFWKYLLAGVFAYSVVVAWTVLTPFLIVKNLGFSADAYGWMSLFIAIAYYFAAHFNRSLVHRFDLQKIFLAGIILIGLSGIVIAVSPNQLLLILIPMFVATYGQSSIFSNTIASALENYAHLPGKASALFSTLQMLITSVMSAVFTFLPNLMVTLGAVLIGLSILTFLLIFNVHQLKFRG